MTERDPVLSRLAALEPCQPASELTARIRAAARQRILPRPVHPLFTVAVAGSVLSYLLWATYFASHLY
jgi:hypothetical protein